jgi:RHS repeat-associated protein
MATAAAMTEFGACSFGVVFRDGYKFTGKERDTETGNDAFGARYYGSGLGRFMSADWSAVPEPVPYANLTNPQTLNLYARVAHPF